MEYCDWDALVILSQGHERHSGLVAMHRVTEGSPFVLRKCPSSQDVLRLQLFSVHTCSVIGVRVRTVTTIPKFKFHLKGTVTQIRNLPLAFAVVNTL